MKIRYPLTAAVLIALSLIGIYRRTRFERPEQRAIARTVSQALPELNSGVERELLYAPDLQRREKVAPIIASYRSGLDEAITRISDVSAPIAEFAPLVRKLERDLDEQGVGAKEQAQIVGQLGKYLYNESLIRQGYDPATRTLKVRMLKLALAHFEGARQLRAEKGL